MNDFHNVLLQAEAPVWSRAAVLSFAAACGAVLGVLGGLVFPPAAALHFLFPVAIAAGHIGLRRITREPARFKGRGAALFGLYVGYFNLALTLAGIYITFF